jgi:hypothetical protein
MEMEKQPLIIMLEVHHGRLALRTADATSNAQHNCKLLANALVTIR